MANIELLAASKGSEDATDEYKTPKCYIFGSNIILALTLIAVSTGMLHKGCYVKAFSETVSAVTFFIMIFGTLEICLRVYYLLVESLQFNSKYGGNVVKLFEALNLSTTSWIVVAFSFSTFPMLNIVAGNTFEHLWRLGPRGWIPAFVCSIVVCEIIGLKDSKLNTTKLISSMQGVDYGTGIAYSYFYGYLKIILPADGVNKGLRAKMEEYEAVQGVRIPVKKLFILLPKSAHIPPDLKEASKNWLESSTSLENEVRDRAGVKKRPYRNTVYKIHPGGIEKNNPPVYVTAEGATPMLTLWEILQHSHPQTAAYREHRDEIIDAFGRTLRTLLDNDPLCKNVCELVIYDDKDAEGRLRNVGEILLRRIEEEAQNSY